MGRQEREQRLSESARPNQPGFYVVAPGMELPAHFRQLCDIVALCMCVVIDVRGLMTRTLFLPFGRKIHYSERPVMFVVSVVGFGLLGISSVVNLVCGGTVTLVDIF